MNEPVKRSSDIEDLSKKYIISPLISWVVPYLVKLRLSPNAVSILGMVFGVSAAYLLYFHSVSVYYSIAGLFMLLVWHVMDGADGRVARITGKQSDLGKIIDGICDYIVFTSLYVSLALLLSQSYGPTIWYLVVAAGVGHSIQAGAYELQRQEFEFWGAGKASAELPSISSAEIKIAKLNGFAKLAARLDILYTRMQYKVTGLEREIRPALYQYLEESPDKTDEFRVAYRKECAPQVLKWAVMCPHYRSMLIVFSCLIGRPELYFITEAVILPITQIVLVKSQRKFNRTLVEKLVAK